MTNIRGFENVQQIDETTTVTVSAERETENDLVTLTISRVMTREQAQGVHDALGAWLAGI